MLNQQINVFRLQFCSNWLPPLVWLSAYYSHCSYYLDFQIAFATKWVARWFSLEPALERELLAPLFHVAKKESGRDIMLGGQKILKNLGESISDTQINVSWSVWKCTQKKTLFWAKNGCFWHFFMCLAPLLNSWSHKTFVEYYAWYIVTIKEDMKKF